MALFDFNATGITHQTIYPLLVDVLVEVDLL